MKNLNILICEGNTPDEGKIFKNEGIPTHTESLKESLSYYNKNLNIDVINPCLELNLNEITPDLKKYDGLYEYNPSIPADINSMIVNGETGLVLLKIAQIIGEDEIEDLDLESVNFVVGIMNELKMINLRNEILLKVLPLKV